MLVAALISLLAASSAAPLPAGTEVARLTITQSIIIRVPARRTHRAAERRPAPPPMPRFKEKHGPKCIAAAAIGGAAIASADSVDFILRGGQRIRAKLEDACPALDYYAGFYVKPPADGKICQDRDSIHTRSGGDCQIDKFRSLTPIPDRH